MLELLTHHSQGVMLPADARAQKQMEWIAEEMRRARVAEYRVVIEHAGAAGRAEPGSQASLSPQVSAARRE
ncbi:hypothetical protein ABZ897_57160 [Nonomuraea sp. NPDC046802]|uniref:hypothetical protein n=1 Tax=Nonomuraea sp. NPDC046802 TaxID=3154919 RepID=UPI0033C93315